MSIGNLKIFSIFLKNYFQSNHLTISWLYCILIKHYLPVCRNWQTRQTQNLLSARVCGFESHYRHHIRTSRLIERYLPWGSYFICINVFFDFYALRKVSKSTAWKLLCKIIFRCWQKCNSVIIKKLSHKSVQPADFLFFYLLFNLWAVFENKYYLVMEINGHAVKHYIPQSL